MFMKLQNFIILFIAIWIIIKPYLFAKKAIGLWVKNKNYSITFLQQRFIVTGPFSSIFSGLYKPVYRIEIKKNDNQLERGWLRIGGLIFENVSVIWDSDLKNPPMSVKILDTIWVLFIVFGLLIILLSSIKF